MLSDEVRRRLAALNRARLPTSAKGPAVTRGEGVIDSVATPAEEELHGHVIRNAWGSHLWIERPLATLWPHADRSLRQAEQTRKAWHRSTSETQQSHPWVDRQLMHCFPQQSLFLDLETCGLAGSMIFLAGILHWTNEQFVLSQLWARHYGEEKPMLQSVWDLVAGRDLLVTFNGKSFDWPQVHDRSTLHRLGARQPMSRNQAKGAERDAALPVRPAILSERTWRREPEHLDLLHVCRRRWRSRLPNCRLQTLERYLCHRHRVDDLPGSEIPQAYHQYVRTGRAGQMRQILHHNALDLVTLLQLALRFFPDSAEEPFRREAI